MRLSRAFIKRNLLEMLRDPLIYVFCVGFPAVMIVLFQVINRFTNGNTPVFEAASLIPGIMVFSFSFVMLIVSLLISKDKTSSFIVRLYTSPMRTADFIIGYAVPCFFVGLGQEVVCLLFGWVVTLITGGTYFSFGAALLLALEMLPALITNIFFGISIGSMLGDKSAPGICSVFISAAGILGGAWMPLDTMGGFETFCRCLPFYPSVYIGRVITGAVHTPTGPQPPAQYAFDSVAALGIIPVALFLVAGIVIAALAFRRCIKRGGN